MTLKKEIMLCSICSLSSGICGEDCAYCTQNVNAKDINRYDIKSEEVVLNEARNAKKYGALGFCLVTSGAGLDDKKTEAVARLARSVNKNVPGLMLIACNGIATKEQLRELKNAGVFSYNHNLETSREFYTKICTSHTWEQRFETNLNAKEAGLELCCGGIYGLGESEADRKSFLKSLNELKPFSSPINFFVNSPTLNYDVKPLEADEAFKIIQNHIKALPECRVMVAGGREHILKERQYEIFDYGVAAIVLGDYLTIKGEAMPKDVDELKRRGFSFAGACH